MSAMGRYDEGALREQWLFSVQETVGRVLPQFVSGISLEDINRAYGGGLICGFYGVRAEISQSGRRWVRGRVRALRVERASKEYRQLVAAIYRLGLQHGEEIRTGANCPT